MSLEKLKESNGDFLRQEVTAANDCRMIRSQPPNRCKTKTLVTSSNNMVQEENHAALVETAGHKQWQTSPRGEETNRKVDATNEGPWD